MIAELLVGPTSDLEVTGNRILLYSWRGRQTMSFDAANRISAMRDAESPTRLTTWAYDARDLMTFQGNWNGTRTTVAFDARGLFTGIRHTKNDGTLIDAAQYQRNEVSTPILRTVGDGGVTTWVYDAAGQLQSEWRSDGYIGTVTYDLAGNRSLLQERLAGGTSQVTTTTYDAANQLVTETTGATVLTHTFDANGNWQSVTSPTAGTTTYSWDARNRLLQVQLQNGVYAAYTYRPDDLRATVNVNEGLLKQVWDVPGMTGFGDLLEELDSGDALKRAYYRAQRLVT